MYRGEILGCVMDWSGPGYSVDGQVEGSLMSLVMYNIQDNVVCVCACTCMQVRACVYLMECVVSVANHVPR